MFIISKFLWEIQELLSWVFLSGLESYEVALVGQDCPHLKTSGGLLDILVPVAHHLSLSLRLSALTTQSWKSHTVLTTTF